MTYGYYIAATRKMHGDPLCARLARLLWRARGHRAPGRYDGVSIWIDPKGQLKARIIARDLFARRTVQYPNAKPFEIDQYVTYDFA